MRFSLLDVHKINILGLLAVPLKMQVHTLFLSSCIQSQHREADCVRFE